jgi:hypothetical protein
MIFCLLLNHIIFKLVHDRILCVLLIDYNVYNKTQYITCTLLGIIWEVADLNVCRS